MLGAAMLLSLTPGGTMARLDRKAIKRISKMKLDNITARITVADWQKYEAY